MDLLSTIIKFHLYLAVITTILSTRNVVANILVYNEHTNQQIEEYRDMPAKFGKPVVSAKLYVIPASNINGCTSITQQTNVSIDFAVLIQRGNCTFEKKVQNAQNAGYAAAIVYNLNSNDLETMSAVDGDNIIIYAVFIGETSGKLLINQYRFGNGFFIMLNDDLPFNINTHLILPFSIVVGLVFTIIIGFMIVKCVRERRRLRRRRLPRSVLKTIPIIKYNKSQPYEMCAICLDDYVEGEKLRVLPCNHVYHSTCIDPWLTKTRRVCPICKRKVLPRRQAQRPSIERNSSGYSSSDSDHDDRSPLINPVANSHNNNNNHGTFNWTPAVAAAIAAPVTSANNDSENQENRPARRENPFNRPINNNIGLNENNSGIGNSTTIWRPILPLWLSNLFQRADSMPIDNNIETSTTSTSTDPVGFARPEMGVLIEISPPLNSSNNLLNVNLSGSFRDVDDTDLLRQAPALRVGVAALPSTTDFAPSSSTLTSQTGHNNRKKDDVDIFA